MLLIGDLGNGIPIGEYDKSETARSAEDRSVRKRGNNGEEREKSEEKRRGERGRTGEEWRTGNYVDAYKMIKLTGLYMQTKPKYNMQNMRNPPILWASVRRTQKSAFLIKKGTPL